MIHRRAQLIRVSAVNFGHCHFNSFRECGSTPFCFEIILAISVKTLSNFSNHIFHTDLDATFVGYEL
jgi:hypothetical protein